MIAHLEGLPSGRIGYVTGRGTGALIAAAEALGLRGCEVLVPVNLCAIAVAGLIASGVIPVLHDVSGETGNAKLDHLKAAWRPSVSGLLAVHNFGQPLEIDAISVWAEQHGLALIEDNCNALGATWNGVPLGTLGDAAIYSFGSGKIADAGGGGAVTAKDPTVGAKLRAKIQLMPLISDLARIAGVEMERRLRRTRQYGAQLEEQRDTYRVFEPHMATRLIGEDVARIGSVLAMLPSNVARRRQMASLWRDHLAGVNVECSLVENGAAPWRYNIRVDAGLRDGLLQALRAAGHSASTWYPRVDTMFAREVDAPGDYPGATSFAAQVINLWADSSVDEDKIRDAARLIAEYAGGRA